MNLLSRHREDDTNCTLLHRWTLTFVITVRNEVAKVMFLQACVCPQGGSTWPGTPPPGSRDPQARYTPHGQVHPPWPGTPPGARYTPWDQVHPQDQVHPPGPGTPPRPGTSPQARYTPLGPDTPPMDQVPPGTRYTPPPRYGHCCGWYVSHWNAFLFY